MTNLNYQKLTREHLPHRIKWLNDAEVNRYLGHQVRNGTDEEFHNKWFDEYDKDESREIFLILDDDKAIGQIGLLDINLYDKNACLYILIGEKDYWHKGIGSEAMDFILDHGFNKLHLRKIWLEVHAKNENAIKLYEKFGFVQEGYFKDNVLYNDGFGDEIRMAKLNPNQNEMKPEANRINMSYLQTQVTTQAVILNEKGRILLLKRNKPGGLFTLPGGTVEKEESVKQALQREIAEETGLEIEIGNPLWIWQSDHIGKSLLGIVFTTNDKVDLNGKIVLSKEHDEYIWLNIDELLSDGKVDPYIKKDELTKLLSSKQPINKYEI